MNDLVEFLRARLDEDEAWARSIADRYGSRDWSFSDDAARGAVIFDKTQTLVAWTEPGAGDLADWFTGNDPARVLAEVKAKRAIEYLHRPAWVEGRNLDGDEREGWWCTECCEAAPCLTFRHLAATFAGHEDYRPEWKP